MTLMPWLYTDNGKRPTLPWQLFVLFYITPFVYTQIYFRMSSSVIQSKQWLLKQQRIDHIHHI